MNKFDKFTAIKQAEAVAYKEQLKFTALGYPPFQFLVEFDHLMKRGCIGQYHPTKDTIVLDIEHWLTHDVKSVLDTIVHEMCHMYVDRYRHKDATHWHGKEFQDLYEKITGKKYVHYDLAGDKMEGRPKNWDTLVQVGTLSL